MYSISEVAKMLSVSRQSVYNRLDRTELIGHIHETDKGKMLTTVGIAILKTMYPVKPDSQKTVSVQSEICQDLQNGQEPDSLFETLLSSLKEQNDYLKSIISEKDRQLSAKEENTTNLTRLLENSQVLLKQQQERILLLEQPTEERDRKTFFEKLRHVFKN